MVPIPVFATIALMPSTDSLTNTPTASTSDGSDTMISAARSGAMYRGLCGQNTNPSAPAPCSTAWSASESLVMPHTFRNISVRIIRIVRVVRIVQIVRVVHVVRRVHSRHQNAPSDRNDPNGPNDSNDPNE